MKDIIIAVLLVITFVGLVRSWSASFKIKYYETWLERLRDEMDVGIGTAFKSVKNDFWRFLK